MEYTLSRSKRKNITICVKDGRVTVKAPLKTDIKVIDGFVASKEKWLARKLRENSERQKRYEDVFAGREFMHLGERFLPCVTDKKRIWSSCKNLFIPQEFYYNGVLIISDLFVAAIKKYYMRKAKKYLGTRLAELSEHYGFSYKKFSLTNAKTKWGSCDSANRIKLNWRLIMLHKGLIDYVIVHELTHTVEHNHSRNFWNGVAAIYPRYKEAIACLKEAGTLINLWR